MPLLTTGNDISTIPGSMITVAAMNAAQITLRKQEEEGSVSNVATDGNGVTRFTLTLDPGRVFAQYTALPVEPTRLCAHHQRGGSGRSHHRRKPYRCDHRGAGQIAPLREGTRLVVSQRRHLHPGAQRVTATLPPS